MQNNLTEKTRGNAKKIALKLKSWNITPANMAKTAMLTAVSFLLYAFVKFSLPMLFPSFLDIQISELPALLAGFSMGPLSGSIVIILKCLLKLPMSSTQFVGELTDILIGLLFVLPASLLYKYKKSRKNAVIGLLLGVLFSTVGAVVVNRYISIPFYIEFYFHGNWNVLLGMLGALYPNITLDNFYAYYLGLGIVPFNLLRGGITVALTFLVYKRLSLALHWDFKSARKSKSVSGNGISDTNINTTESFSMQNNQFVSHSTSDTAKYAERIAEQLEGGEIILLSGELGAGKTTFTKGLAKALGVSSEVTSPTFTILNVYDDGRIPLYHMDMYRITSADELYETGVEDYLSKNGVTVIEWNKLDGLKGKIYNIAITATGENERRFVCDIENK